MTFIELPHLNVLTKMDQLVDSCCDLELDWPLSYYIEGNVRSICSSEPAAFDHAETEMAVQANYGTLTRALYELVDDMNGLVSFTCVSVQDGLSLLELSRAIDKASGFTYGALTLGNDSIFSVAQSSCYARHPGEYWEDKIQAAKVLQEREKDVDEAP